MKGQENWEIDPLLSGYSREKEKRIRNLALDPMELARRGLRRERLDQILTEVLMGVRG